jgi:hypothetical protein
MYFVIRQFDRIKQLLNSKNLITILAEIAKKIDHSETAALQLAADILTENGMLKEAYNQLAQLSDASSLIRIRIMTKEWNEALALAKMPKELLPDFFLP